MSHKTGFGTGSRVIVDLATHNDPLWANKTPTAGELRPVRVDVFLSSCRYEG